MYGHPKQRDLFPLHNARPTRGRSGKALGSEAVMLLTYLLLLYAVGGTSALPSKKIPLLGSYPHVVQNSLRFNLSSEADVSATVAAWKATGQTLGGFYIDECYYFQLLRPFLEATRGHGISIFGMLRSHNGPIYCMSAYGPSTVNSSAPANSGQELNWTRVATTLAALSLEFPHFYFGN